jgi:hypothetical protein
MMAPTVLLLITDCRYPVVLVKIARPLVHRLSLYSIAHRSSERHVRISFVVKHGDKMASLFPLEISQLFICHLEAVIIFCKCFVEVR